MAGRGAGDEISERVLLRGVSGTDIVVPPPAVQLDAGLPAPPLRTTSIQRRGRSPGDWSPVLDPSRLMAASASAALSLEAERGGAFLAAPVLVGTGAVIYFRLHAEPDATAIAAGVGVVGALAWLCRHLAALRIALLAALMLLAGMAAAKFETWRAGTRVIGGEISTRLTGRIASVEERANGRVRLTLDVLATERPVLRYRPDRVRLTLAARDIEWQPGQTVQGVARLVAPIGPLRPDSYDFAFESYFDRIGANGFFLGQPRLVAEPAAADAATRLALLVERARESLADRIRGHLPGAEGEIAAALVAGVRAGIPEEANEALRITGLAHVLSISGLHMALVAGVVIASLRAGFALFPAFASRQPVRKYAAGLALVALSLYLLISGAQVAAQRSFIMIAVMLVALLFDRAALTMRNLSIAALVILLGNPHEAVGPSFQMSFAATAVLIAAYGWWADRRERRSRAAPAHRALAWRVGRKMLFYGVGLAATSILAGAATGIFGAWHFQRVSALGLVANLAAMPIVSVVVMPSAVLAVLLMPFDLDGWAFAAMGQGLTWTLDIASWLAARSPVDAIGAIPASSVLLMAAGLAVATVASTNVFRLAALPPMALGLLLMLQRELPTVYVSEDAKLLGVVTEDGRLAVSRARGGAFAIEDWSRAMLAPEILRPRPADPGQAMDRAEDGQKSTSDPISPPVPLDPTTGFACTADLCVARHVGGAVIGWAQTMPAAAALCDAASLIVIADATAANPCPDRRVTVITARHLALRGSAQVRFDAGSQAFVEFALPETLRPWHDHRRFSRAARGMPPYRRPEAPKKGAAADTAGASEATLAGDPDDQ